MKKTAGPEELKKDVWVDAAKGIAICSVLMIHSGANSLPGLLGKIGEIGPRGVQMLYVLSAYLTFVSLERYHVGKDSLKIRSGGYNQWWIRKLIRLLPVYYTALFLYMLILKGGGDPYWLGSQSRVSLMNLISHIFLLHGLVPHYMNSVMGIEWYLGNLVLFYFAAPFLYRKVNSLGRSVCFCILTALGANVVNYVAHIFAPQTDAYIYESYIDSFWFFTQLPVLAMGIFMYHFFRRTDHLRLYGEKRLLSYCILLFSVCMIWGEMYGHNQLFGLSKYVLCAVWFTGIMISQVIHESPVVCNIFFQKVGQHSYSVYLFHWLFLKLYTYVPLGHFNQYLDWGIRYVLILGISYVTAIGLERFIEKPAVRFLAKAAGQ